MPIGFIQFFIRTKGYGYVRIAESREEFFFKARGNDLEWKKGEKVSFSIIETNQGLIAVDLVRTDSQPSPDK
ncbi:MAG: cold shock domain-containing protein [Saprospiraceae bacterium]|nr:cold shock domain-containing protein [Saprospiraceae bacterium]